MAQTARSPAANAGDVGSIPGSGQYPGEGNGNPLQYSYLGNLIEETGSYSPWHPKESDITDQVTLSRL